MTPEFIRESLTMILSVSLFSILLILPPAVWIALKSFAYRAIRKAEKKAARRAYLASKRAHRNYVEDMFRQIR